MAFAGLLLLGRRLLPFVVLAPLAGDIVIRTGVVSTSLSVTLSLVSGGLYFVACTLLSRLPAKPHLPPQNLRDLAILLAGAVVSSIVVSSLSVAAYAIDGLVPWEQYASATARFWVGDLIGITIVAPVLIAVCRPETGYRITWEIPCLRDRPGREPGDGFRSVRYNQLPAFYILFIPIVLVAVRFGYEAVVINLAGVQVALIGAGRVEAMSAQEVTTLQGMLLILAITGMTAGMLVTQQRKAERRLRQQHEVQARLQQMGSLGELTSLIAHEVNQPLTAAATYARVVLEGIASDIPPAKLQEVAEKAVHQVTRAAEVVRRLRDLVRLGRSQVEPTAIPQIIGEMLKLVQPDLEDLPGIDIEIDVPIAIPLVLADRVQIEQVLLNLVRNSLEAFDASGRRQGRIGIIVRTAGSSHVVIAVEDDGPGFGINPSPEMPTLRSTKPHGLGVGLALSRTIIASHGGDFDVESRPVGARVRFTLPTVN